MTAVKVHPDAANDIRELMLLDRLAAVRILATLEQLKRDPTLFKKLCIHGYRDPVQDRIDIKKWIRLHNNGAPIWRLKITDMEQNGQHYRVMYCFSSAAKVIHILAIKPRSEINYDDPTDLLTARIMRARVGLR